MFDLARGAHYVVHVHDNLVPLVGLVESVEDEIVESKFKLVKNNNEKKAFKNGNMNTNFGRVTRV